MKFGGTSVDQVAEVEKCVDSQAKKSKPIMVVSAYSGQTDKLLAIARDFLDDPEGWSEHGLSEHFRGVFLETASIAQAQLSHGPKRNFDFGTFQKSIHAYMTDYIDYISQKMLPLLQGCDPSQGVPDQIKIYVTDLIIGAGEIFSSKILADVMTLRSDIGRVYEAVSLHDIFDLPHDAYSVNPGSQEIFFEDAARAISTKTLAVLERGHTPVVSGYMGFVPGGIKEVIDRGYTDFTASAAALGLSLSGIPDEQITSQNWKRVPGALSVDPRISEPNYHMDTHVVASDFKVARVVSQMSRKELAELSALGGMKAINPRVMEVLRKTRIAMEVRNTLDPESPGTRITLEDDMENRGIRFVAGRSGDVMYRVQDTNFPNITGALARIYDECRDLGIPVDAVTTSETSVSFSINGKHKNAPLLEEKLDAIGKVDKFPGLAMVCCIGNDMKDREGVLALITTILAANNIVIQFDGGDPDSNVYVLVAEKDREKSIKCLHREIIEKGQQSINDVPGFAALRAALTA